MHDTALDIGRRFFMTYFDGRPIAILDVGSQDVNGTLRDCAPSASHYVGVDLEPARGVDIVLDDPHALPFDDGSFDAVVSTSCFEHDTMFWLTFLEMVRVTANGGYIYVNAPSNGQYHTYPRDNWRFYPDAALALVEWARRQGHELFLVESFIAPRSVDEWNDSVMVFCAGQSAGEHQPRITDQLTGATNIRRGEVEAVENRFEQPEDLRLLADAHARLATMEQAAHRATPTAPALPAPLWIGFDC